MTTAHVITMPNGSTRYMIGSKFASKANYDAFVGTVTENQKLVAALVKGFPKPRKSPRANIDRKPRIILRYQANEHSMEYNGSVFDLSGLTLKDAAVIRYNVVATMFGKPSADTMVANYAKEAA